MKWWDDIPETNTTRSASAIIGADVAGALVTAAMNAGFQYASTGKIDGKQLAYHAVGGAIVGSTGVVGKLGKLIGNIFKR